MHESFTSKYKVRTIYHCFSKYVPRKYCNSGKFFRLSRMRSVNLGTWGSLLVIILLDPFWQKLKINYFPKSYLKHLVYKRKSVCCVKKIGILSQLHKTGGGASFCWTDFEIICNFPASLAKFCPPPPAKHSKS